MLTRRMRRLQVVTAAGERANRSVRYVRCRPALVAIADVILSLLLMSATRAQDKPSGKEIAQSVGLILHASHVRDDISDDFAQMVAIDPETGEFRCVYSVTTHGRMAADGRHIVYWKRPGRDAQEPPGIYVQDTTEGVPPRLIFDRQGYPSWSHQGQKVVVSVDVGERKYETWRVNVDGTAPTKLPVPETDLVFDCSDDGNWLAARTMSGEPALRGRLTLFHPDGAGHRALTEGSAAEDRFVIPRISPDARQVAYTEIITKKEIRTSRLYIVDVDGKNRLEIQVPFDPDTTAQVCWAPDGKRLAVNAIDLQAHTAWIGVVDIEPRRFRKLPVVVRTLPPLAIPENALQPQNRVQPNVESWFLRICDWR